MEVPAPAVAIRRGDDAIYIGELVPDMRELREKGAGDALAGEEPYLLSHEEPNGDAAQREQRKLGGDVGNRERDAGERTHSVARARIDFLETVFHDGAHQSRVLRVKALRRVVPHALSLVYR